MPGYTPVPEVLAGDIIDEVFINTYWGDNFAAGVPDIFTAKGQLAVASGADAAGVLNVGRNLDVLLGDPGAPLGMRWGLPYLRRTVLRKSTPQAIPVSATVDVSWDIEDADDENLHSNVSNNHRITFIDGGVYLVGMSIGCSNANINWVAIYRNTTLLGAVKPSGTNLSQAYLGIVWVAAGDYVVVTAQNGSGGSVNITTLPVSTLFCIRLG